MLTTRIQRGAIVVAFAASVLGAACHLDSAGTGPVVTVPPTIGVTFTGGALLVELAVTPVQRDSGLMNRTNLGADYGMLFVFPYAVQLEFADYFYMKNTPIALSVAFLDSAKKVINIEDMQPNTLTPHYAKAPYLYAVEANLGWFAAHGVVAGSVAAFTLPPGTTPSY